MDEFVLQCSGIAREFRGNVVLDGLDLSVRRGSLHALVGPSGAGKTTLFNIITNTLPPCRGRVVFDGVDIVEEKAAQTQRRGLVRAFQAGTLLPQLSALENVRLALQRKAGMNLEYWRGKGGGVAFEDEAAALLEQADLFGQARHSAAELTLVQRRALEILLALALDPLLLLLDEPLAGLSGTDRTRIIELVRLAGADRSLLMIESDMDVIGRLADAATLLDQGQARPLVRAGAGYAPAIRLVPSLGAAA